MGYQVTNRYVYVCKSEVDELGNIQRYIGRQRDGMSVVAMKVKAGLLARCIRTLVTE